MSSELLAAFIGLLTAALGVFSAYLSNSKLVVYRHEGGDPGVPVPPGESHFGLRLAFPKKHERGGPCGNGGRA